jgi:hypothetical protein
MSPEHAAGLDRHIPRLHLDNVPLDKSLVALADAAHLSIVVDWESLWLRGGVQRDRAVSVDLIDATTGEALRAILTDQTWNVHGGVISIGGDPEPEPRVYDIRDLAEDYARSSYPLTRPSPGRSPSLAEIEWYRAGLREYAKLLTTRVGGWMDMRELAGRLIINATPEDHTRIAAALNQLRAQVVKNPKALLP